MSARDDGGPAFPTSNGGSPDEGMTLRDYFAAKAMQAYISRDRWMPETLEVDDGPSFDELISRYAYEAADAMLVARGKP